MAFSTSSTLAIRPTRISTISSPKRRSTFPTVCHSLDMALEHLDKDREFLTRGGVFTNDVIDAYIGLKMQEITRFRMSTHPVELEMYYSC
jgi:glutamine synthetase